MSNAQEPGKAAGITLRAVTPEDNDFLFALYASTREDEMAAWGWEAAQQEMFLRLQFVAQQQRYLAERAASESQIIMRDGQPIGRVISIRSADEIRLADIALLTANRGAGIGSALISGLQAEAAQAGLPLRLHVTYHNRAARLYERLGFVVIGNTGSHFKMEWRPETSSVRE